MIILYCMVLYCIRFGCIVLYVISLYCIVLHDIVLCSNLSPVTACNFIVLYGIAWYYIVFDFIACITRWFMVLSTALPNYRVVNLVMPSPEPRWGHRGGGGDEGRSRCRDRKRSEGREGWPRNICNQLMTFSLLYFMFHSAWQLSHPQSQFNNIIFFVQDFHLSPFMLQQAQQVRMTMRMMTRLLERVKLKNNYICFKDVIRGALKKSWACDPRGGGGAQWLKRRTISPKKNCSKTYFFLQQNLTK